MNVKYNNSIQPDEQLIFECETLLPKIGEWNSHILKGRLSVYASYCYIGNIEKANQLETYLRQIVVKARISQGKQIGLI